MLTLAQRQALQALKAEERAIKREARKNAPVKVQQERAFPKAAGQRDPRQEDEAFRAYVREWPCIACLVEGAPALPGPVEAAHQKLAIANKGWREGGLGPRVHDHRCIGLCAWHHRLAPNSCDTGGQRKFWDRLGLGDGIADLCRDVHVAFRASASALPILQRYAAMARRKEPA